MRLVRRRGFCTPIRLCFCTGRVNNAVPVLPVMEVVIWDVKHVVRIQDIKLTQFLLFVTVVPLLTL